MDELNRMKILGEIRAKELLEKTKPIADKVKPVVDAAVKNPYVRGSGKIGGSFLGGYLLGDTINKGTELLTGKSISDRIYSPNMDDGRYDPNRQPNPEFLQARAAMDERREDFGLALQNISHIMDQATGSRNSIPYSDPQGPYSASPVEEFGYASDPLNRVRGVTSFMETPNEATGFSDSGLRIPNLTENELEFLREQNDQRLIQETGFGQPIFSGSQSEETPIALGDGTFGNAAAQNQTMLAAQREDPIAPFSEGQVGAPGSPVSAISQSLQAMGPGATNDERAERAAALANPYMQTTQAQRNAENAEVFARAAQEAMIKDAIDLQTSNLRSHERAAQNNSMLSGIPSIGDYKQQLRNAGHTGGGLHSAATEMRNKAILERRKEVQDIYSQQIDMQNAINAGIIAQEQNERSAEAHDANMRKAEENAETLTKEELDRLGFDALLKGLNRETIGADEQYYINTYLANHPDALEDYNISKTQLNELRTGTSMRLPRDIAKDQFNQETLDLLRLSGEEKVIVGGELKNVADIKDFPTSTVNAGGFVPKKISRR
tara:strand:+ start:2706 stop:4358 length:1653 start_codon:yes stop_codon:yes gene_type:complete